MRSLSGQLFKNISSSFLSFGVRILLAFVFIPYITATYGDARYGIWVIIFQLITYFTVFDFSVTSALTRFVSKFLAKREFSNINKFLNSAHLVYSSIGVIAFILIYFGGCLLMSYFKVTQPELLDEGSAALIIMGGYLALHFIFSAFASSLGAFQREDIARFTILCEEIVRFGILIYLLTNGYGLVALAWTVLGVSFARHVVNIIILKRLYPEVRFSPGMANRDSFKQIIEYSKISFFIAIGWLVMYNTDSFLLGLISSTAAAGVYQPGAQLMLYFRNIVNNIGVPLIPIVSHLETEQRFDEIREIYRKGIRYVSYISISLLIGIYLYATDFVALWLPPEFSDTATVMILLSVGTVFFLPQIIGNSILFGCGKHNRVLAALFCEATLKIILALYLVPKYDITGMALANSIPQVLIYLIIYPYLFYKAVGFAVDKVLANLSTAFFFSIVFCGLPAFVMKTVLTIDSWTMFIVAVGTSIVGFGIGAFFLIEKDDKTRLTALFRK